MKTEKQRMLAGELYDASDAEIQSDHRAAMAWLVRYNAMLGATSAERRALLVERFARVGDNVNIRPPFHCDYGFNIDVGHGVFLNFNCVILDVCAVSIGDKTQIGPGVQILTADHPRDPQTRESGLEFGRPVRIGRNVWIGGGAVILPGITVGNDAVIGAAAVVTRDVPAGSTVVGNPARPVSTEKPRFSGFLDFPAVLTSFPANPRKLRFLWPRPSPPRSSWFPAPTPASTT